MKEGVPPLASETGACQTRPLASRIGGRLTIALWQRYKTLDWAALKRMVHEQR